MLNKKRINKFIASIISALEPKGTERKLVYAGQFRKLGCTETYWMELYPSSTNELEASKEIIKSWKNRKDVKLLNLMPIKNYSKNHKLSLHDVKEIRQVITKLEVKYSGDIAEKE